MKPPRRFRTLSSRANSILARCGDTAFYSAVRYRRLLRGTRNATAREREKERERAFSRDGAATGCPADFSFLGGVGRSVSNFARKISRASVSSIIDHRDHSRWQNFLPERPATFLPRRVRRTFVLSAVESSRDRFSRQLDPSDLDSQAGLHVCFNPLGHGEREVNDSRETFTHR